MNFYNLVDTQWHHLTILGNWVSPGPSLVSADKHGESSALVCRCQVRDGEARPMEKTSGVSWFQVLGLVPTGMTVRGNWRGFSLGDLGPKPCCSGILGTKLSTSWGAGILPISESNVAQLQGQRKAEGHILFSIQGVEALTESSSGRWRVLTEKNACSSSFWGHVWNSRDPRNDRGDTMTAG